MLLLRLIFAPVAKKVFRLLYVNLLVLILLTVVVELVFGDWLKKGDGLEHLAIPRSRHVVFDPSTLYDNGGKEITYLRDKYGLRGNCHIKPEDIDVLTIGGSTTDQRYIDENATWQVHLANELANMGFQLCIGNAGLDGHSTYGHHIIMFDWLLEIDNLRPEYILFYVGLNDFYSDVENQYDLTFRKTLWQQASQNSVIFKLTKRLLGARTGNELGHGGANLNALTYTVNGLLTAGQRDSIILPKIEEYRKRLDLLASQSYMIGAKPVFISQPSFHYKWMDSTLVGIEQTETKQGFVYNGVDFYHMLQMMNSTIEEVCLERGCSYIDLTSESIFTKEDYYDLMHMTPSGTEKLGKVIASKWLPTSED